MVEDPPELLIVFDQCDWISGYDKVFTIMFNTLLREGAGLGIHVLISTSNLLNPQDIPRDAFNYCICHRAENALSSRVAIGTDEPAYLPIAQPGSAMLATRGGLEVTRVMVPGGSASDDRLDGYDRLERMIAAIPTP